MGTQGARLRGSGLLAAVAVVGVLVAACGPSAVQAGAQPSAGSPGNALSGAGQSGAGGSGGTSAEGDGSSAAPGRASPGLGFALGSPGPSAAPSPTAKPKPVATPRPSACRGAIPSSISLLEGPLHHPIGPTTTDHLWYVVDGDTIRLTNGDYVRLIGMDTPETVKPGTPVQPYGPQASADLKRMLAGRATVTLEEDVSNTDRYGRLLRFVWIQAGREWLQLDYELVVRGDARIETVPPDVRYAANYAAAERVAQEHHVGRWATC
jgi:endonuclease YncB( thermonuclease family)